MRIKTFLNNVMLIFFVYACSSDDERSISDAIGMENLTGLKFTESERDSALEGMSLLRDKYDTMRTIQIPNQVPMPLYFDPRIIGQDLPKGRERYLFQEFPTNDQTILRIVHSLPLGSWLI